MDPASARVALTLQFNDVEEILKTSGNASEARAFTVLRTELVKKLQEVDGQCAAIDTLREENVKKATFMRLVAEERQAINDHETACRLAGVTVPPRPNVGAVAERAADDIAHALNGSIKKPKNVELGESQVSPQAATPPPPSLKRPAPDETADRGPKRVKILLPATIPCRSSLKRPAFGDPASLRDKTADDGPKRVKFADEPEQKVTDKVSIGTPAAKPDEPANPNSSFFRSGVATHAVCSACLETHRLSNVLRLSCKRDDEIDNHAYLNYPHRRPTEIRELGCVLTKCPVPRVSRGPIRVLHHRPNPTPAPLLLEVNPAIFLHVLPSTRNLRTFR